MSFVPSVERTHLTRKRKGRPRKGDVDRDESSVPSTPIYQLGKRGSVMLSKGDKWNWKWLAADSGVPLTVLQAPRVLFPATRQPDDFPTLPLDVMIDSATRYIHDTPDIYEPDVVAALAVEELTALHSEKIAPPARRQVVAVISHPVSRFARTLLCFASGAIDQNLNISPFIANHDGRSIHRVQSRFFPTASPIESFPSPILQLSSSPAVSKRVADNYATALLVRSERSTYFYNVVPNIAFEPPTPDPPVTALRVAELHMRDTEGRRHVDVHLDPINFGRGAVVDEGGGVWLWYEEKEMVFNKIDKVLKLHKVRDVVPDPHDGFFQVAFGTREDTLLVMSRREVVLIDIATFPVIPPPTVILKATDTNPFISLDKTAAERGASLTCIGTSRGLVWIDDATDGTPLLQWNIDGARYMTQLDITVIPGEHFEDVEDGEESDMVLVSSLQLESIIALQVSKNKPIMLQALPWSLGGLPALGNIVILPFQNLAEHRGFICLVGTDTDGAILLAKLTADKAAAEEHRGAPLPHIRWNGPMTALANQRPGYDRRWERAEAKYKVMSARWVWMYINGIGDLPDWDPVIFIQELREGNHFEHVMIGAELLRDFAYGEGPFDRRSTLLRRIEFPTAQKKVNMLKGLDEVYPDYFPFSENIGGLLDSVPSPDDVLQVLHKPNKRERLEAGRLTLDLALSASIVYSEPLGKQSADDDLFAAAGALSLEEKPVQLRLLQARDNDFATVNPLLSEWVIGEDPHKYEWQAPDQSIPKEARKIRPLPATRTIPTASIPPSIQQVQAAPIPTVRPAVPAVLSIPAIASMAPTFNSLPKAPPRVARSSPPPIPPSSSLPHTQTQAEPGRFGARHERRKKAGKKRQGGF